MYQYVQVAFKRNTTLLKSSKMDQLINKSAKYNDESSSFFKKLIKIGCL